MSHIPLLREIALVAATAVGVALVVGRLRMPAAAGLLLAGVFMGPYGAGFVRDTHAIESIAEVGVVLLLFTIGLEFSLARLRHIMQRVALGGLIQVAGTVSAVALGVMAIGATSGVAVFFGFVVALSSTALVLRVLAERRETEAPQGRFIVGALIFQDLCVVPMVLIVPMLSEGKQAGSLVIALALLKAVAVIALVLSLARVIVPRLFFLVAASRSREVFLLAVVAICAGTAWVTSLAGLSLALGAFLGGVVVADTDYRHRALGDMLSLRDVFVSFFFVSLGMFFDVEVLAAAPLAVLAWFITFVLVKGAVATVAALAMRFPPRVAWLAGLGLAQFGEFGFVLVKLGVQSQVVSEVEVKPLLAAGIISMFLTPILVQVAPHVTAGERLLAPLARLMGARGIEELDHEPALEGHVVVVGYGFAGETLAAGLRRLGVRHAILELNPENVRRGREVGAPVFYADATSEEALGHAHIATARAVVITINDLSATERVVEAAQRVAPAAHIVARTHYLAERQVLLRQGVIRVVAEEGEGMLQVLAQLFRVLEVPPNVQQGELERARELADSWAPQKNGRL